ncbi:MAG: hypothetical protein RB296_10550 [Acidobacteriota bacterium]|nr:hypothetical protein [Acidobacteriota bacterium]
MRKVTGISCQETAAGAGPDIVGSAGFNIQEFSLIEVKVDHISLNCAVSGGKSSFFIESVI